MCDDGSHAHRTGNLIAAEQRVLKQGPSKSTLLVFLIDGEPRKDEDRHRPLGWLALEEALRGVIWLDLTDRQRVEADHSPSICGDESASRAGRLRVAGMPLQPAVQGHLAGYELGEIVRASQRLWPRIAHRPVELLEDARFGVKPAEALGNPGGSLEQLRELVPLGRREGELLAICENSLGFRDRGASDEAAVAGLTRSACGADEGILRILDSEVPAESSGVRRGGHANESVQTLCGHFAVQAGGSRLTLAARPIATRVIA